ncbi:MAG: protein kinase, partial [Muribaculaceae bacterium]|nr:protein kinase [Muribaculaceae bacterium]
KILDIIGHGGYGKTYLVENRFGDKCVVKEFFMSTYCTRDDKGNVISSNPDNEDIEKIVEEQRNKFEKEAITIRSLNHPNIIKVHNLFFENNTIYYVMPYVEGGSLKDKASKKPLPEQRVRKYLNQILDALEYMHNKGICHLDIKPGNIMLANDGETVVLIDFGTSKVFNSQSMNKTMMSTTTPPFTPGFASAEQENGKVTDLGTHSDIYSLGATLLFLLTGDVPDRAYEFNQKPFPQLKGVSQSMYNTIRRAMAYWVKDRINSIAEFRELLSPPAPYTNSHKKTDETRECRQNYDSTKDRSERSCGKETSTKQIEQAGRTQQTNILGRLEIATSSMSSKVKQMCNGCNKSLFTLSFLDRFKKNKAFRPGLISVLLILVAVISIVGVVLYKSNRGAYKFEDYSQNDTIIGVNGDTIVTSPEGDTLSISPREEPPLVILPETKISFKMIYVKGGTFMMGAQSTDPNGVNYDSDAEGNEQPVHSVTLDDYYIGETEVTQELWEAVMGTNPSEYKGSNRPVENVLWHDCQDFIRKLNQLTGK